MVSSHRGSFGPFHVRALLGHGWFGELFRGEAAATGEPVIIRTVQAPLEAAQRESLLESFQWLCDTSLDHPAIGRPIACGIDGDTPYLVHVFVPGTPLDEFLDLRGPQPVDEAIVRATQLAGALDFAAAAGVHHGAVDRRDVFLSAHQTAIAGFGVAQAAGQAGIMIDGRRPYQSPQQRAGQPPTHADDVYALAVLVLQLLCGRADDQEEPASLLALLDEAGLSPALRAVFEAALASDPRERPGSALAFAAALQAAVAAGASTDSGHAGLEAEPGTGSAAMPGPWSGAAGAWPPEPGAWQVGPRSAEPDAWPAEPEKWSAEPAPWSAEHTDEGIAGAGAMGDLSLRETADAPGQPSPALQFDQAPSDASMPELPLTFATGEPLDPPPVSARSAPERGRRARRGADEGPSGASGLSGDVAAEWGAGAGPGDAFRLALGTEADVEGPRVDARPTESRAATPPLPFELSIDAAPGALDDAGIGDRTDDESFVSGEPTLWRDGGRMPRHDDARGFREGNERAFGRDDEPVLYRHEAESHGATGGDERRRWTLMAAGFGVLLLIVAGAFFLVERTSDSVPFPRTAAPVTEGPIASVPPAAPETTSEPASPAGPVVIPDPTAIPEPLPEPVVEPLPPPAATADGGAGPGAAAGGSQPAPGGGSPAGAASAPAPPADGAPARVPAPRPEPPPGRILVRSTPAGAQVLVDGEPRGTTPLAVRELPLGGYTIGVTHPTYGARQERVTLTAAVPARSVDFDLDRPAAGAPGAGGASAGAGAGASAGTSTGSAGSRQGAGVGAVQVDSRPAGAQVFINDRLVGSTPLLVPDLAAGSHVVRLELPGYRRWTTSVTLPPGERVRVAASLEP